MKNFTFLLFLTGCTAPYNPRVHVTLSVPAGLPERLPGIEEAARLGGAFWSCVGARVDLIPGGEELWLWERAEAGINGSYDTDAHLITVNPESWLPGSELFRAGLLAHEIGHAFGLDHLAGAHVMTGEGVPGLRHLSDGDVSLFNDFWGTSWLGNCPDVPWPDLLSPPEGEKTALWPDTRPTLQLLTGVPRTGL